MAPMTPEEIKAEVKAALERHAVKMATANVLDARVHRAINIEEGRQVPACGTELAAQMTATDDYVTCVECMAWVLKGGR